MEHWRKHPLVYGVEREGEKREYGDAKQAAKDATEEAQALINALGKRAEEIQTGKKRLRPLVAASDLKLKIVMAAYVSVRPKIKNKSRPAESLLDITDVLGEDATCRELDAPTQHMIIANRRSVPNKWGTGRQWTDNTILTRQTCVWTMMHTCAGELGILRADAIPERVSIARWNPAIQLGKRRLRGFKIEHLVKFVTVAFQCERWLRDTLIGIGLAPRPDDGHDLQPKQIDLENRIAYLRPYQADGTLEDESKKRSATVKFGPTMARWFEHWNAADASRPAWCDPHYVLHRGKRIQTCNWIHRVAGKAGFELPHGMGAYIFRHYIASYLMANGCPLDQVKMLLGHIVVDGATAFYVELAPEFMARAANLIEDLLHEIDRRLPQGLSLLNPRSVAEDPDDVRIVFEGESEGLVQAELEDQPDPNYDEGMDVWDDGSHFIERATQPRIVVARNLEEVKRNFDLETPGVSWDRTSMSEESCS